MFSNRILAMVVGVFTASNTFFPCNAFTYNAKESALLGELFFESETGCVGTPTFINKNTHDSTNRAPSFVLGAFPDYVENKQYYDVYADPGQADDEIGTFSDGRNFFSECRLANSTDIGIPGPNRLLHTYLGPFQKPSDWVVVGLSIWVTNATASSCEDPSRLEKAGIVGTVLTLPPNGCETISMQNTSAVSVRVVSENEIYLYRSSEVCEGDFELISGQNCTLIETTDDASLYAKIGDYLSVQDFQDGNIQQPANQPAITTYQHPRIFQEIYYDGECEQGIVDPKPLDTLEGYLQFYGSEYAIQDRGSLLIGSSVIDGVCTQENDSFFTYTLGLYSSNFDDVQCDNLVDDPELQFINEDTCMQVSKEDAGLEGTGNVTIFSGAHRPPNDWVILGFSSWNSTDPANACNDTESAANPINIGTVIAGPPGHCFRLSPSASILVISADEAELFDSSTSCSGSSRGNVYNSCELIDGSIRVFIGDRLSPEAFSKSIFPDRRISPSPSPSPSEGDDFPVALVAGSAAGAVVGLLLFVVVIRHCTKKKSKARTKTGGEMVTGAPVVRVEDKY